MISDIKKEGNIFSEREVDLQCNTSRARVTGRAPLWLSSIACFIVAWTVAPVPTVPT
ncbi:hypothetical protein J6590_080690, partial [Homalodisca vitripennis]